MAVNPPGPFVPQAGKPTPRNEQVKKYVIGAVCVCSVILIGGVTALSTGKLPQVPKVAVLVGTFVFGGGGFIASYFMMRKVKSVDKQSVDGESRGYTTLAFAISKSHTWTIKKELWFGANPFAPCMDGSPLAIARNLQDGVRRREVLDLFSKYNYDTCY